jgi:tetratricopeptide (TPR) repeat protein
MTKTRVVCAVAGAVLVAAVAGADPSGRRFEWTTSSAEAKQMLKELQLRIENFQGGPQNRELAQKIVATDPNFAMGQYYLSVFNVNPDEAFKEYEKSRELAKKASDGERRFIEAMYHVRANQGQDFAKSIEPMEAVAKDYPGERLVFAILGQLYAGDNQADKAKGSFLKAQAIGPRTARVEAFLAGDELLKGNYGKARTSYQSVEKNLPKGSVPFAIRFGVTFSHLYEGNVDAALESLRTYLAEYRAGGLDQQFPEVFIWNAMARINLENGRLDEAMKAYQEGFKSVPGSTLEENEKKVWLGRLHHGTGRTLARMGKYDEAWKECETLKKMIDEGGEEGKQYVPAYHYMAGYVKLEAGDVKAAIDHLKQSDLTDPFHKLLLARAYERSGDKEAAKKAYQEIVEFRVNNLERALSYPEAKKKVASL